jgi:spore maturation protein CgeB
MKLVIFGLSISSSWGNGHATLWRGLCREFIARGHQVTFFERDVPYYSEHRDYPRIQGGRLILYHEWDEVLELAKAELASADIGLVSSYCPDALAATELLLHFPLGRVFYDLDTPVTLARLELGDPVAYIGPRGLRDFDLVLSFTGGKALTLLRERLGASEVLPLYGSVDPERHHPVSSATHYQADLSYLGTYAADRQEALLEFLIEPARRLPTSRFVIGGAQYPADFPWTSNIHFVRHLQPDEHPAFFSSSRLTLNITRRQMAALGYCPSGRLFEAAACGAPLISDDWEGIERFFEPGQEIFLAHSTDQVLEALRSTDSTLAQMAFAARRRILREHTSAHRALELEQALLSIPQLAETC